MGKRFLGAFASVVVLPSICAASQSGQAGGGQQETLIAIAFYALVALTVVIIAMVLHKKEMVTIYTDYTDVLMVFCSFIIPAASFVPTSYFNLPVDTRYIVAACMFGVFFVANVVHTVVSCRNIVLFPIALVVKYALCVLFVVIAGCAMARDQGKSETYVEYRSSQLKLLASLGIVGAIILLAVRYPAFTGLSLFFKRQGEEVGSLPA